MMPGDDPGPKPHLRIVPEVDEATRKRLEDEARQREQERRRTFAGQDLRIAHTALAANVLRIVRGAGKPWALAQDCANVLDAVDAYKDAFRRVATCSSHGDVLRFELEHRGGEDRIERDPSVEQMIRAAATRRLDQIHRLGLDGHERA